MGPHLVERGDVFPILRKPARLLPVQNRSDTPGIIDEHVSRADISMGKVYLVIIAQAGSCIMQDVSRIKRPEVLDEKIVELRYSIERPAFAGGCSVQQQQKPRCHFQFGSWSTFSVEIYSLRVP